jgi:hypothetical protein
MVDTVREPYTLEVNLQGTETVSFMTDSRISVYRLQHLTDAEVIASKLVESNITPVERRFREIINQFFL